MTKQDDLCARLAAGWCDAATLASDFGWKAHTLRARVCKLTPPAGSKLERQRANGVTSYRFSGLEAS